MMSGLTRRVWKAEGDDGAHNSNVNKAQVKTCVRVSFSLSLSLSLSLSVVMENFLSKGEIMVVIAALRKVVAGDYKTVGARTHGFVTEALDQFHLAVGRIVSKEEEEKGSEEPIIGDE